jgi:hypothetical protein
MGAGQEGRFGARSDEPEARSEVRWGARRKEGVVVCLLRGAWLDLLACEKRAARRADCRWARGVLGWWRRGVKVAAGRD